MKENYESQRNKRANLKRCFSTHLRILTDEIDNKK